MKCIVRTLNSGDTVTMDLEYIPSVGSTLWFTIEDRYKDRVYWESGYTPVVVEQVGFFFDLHNGEETHVQIWVKYEHSGSSASFSEAAGWPI